MTGLRRVEQVMGTAISVHVADPLPRQDLELLMDEAFVAGTLALLLQAFPGMSADRQAAALENSAVDLGAAGADNTYGHGRLELSLPISGWAPHRTSQRACPHPRLARRL